MTADSPVVVRGNGTYLLTSSCCSAKAGGHICLREVHERLVLLLLKILILQRLDGYKGFATLLIRTYS